MTFEDRARLIWEMLESNLSDRGCFNGIGDDIMEEIRDEEIAAIIQSLGKQ